WIPENLEYDLYDLQKSANVYVVFREEKTIPKNFPLFLVMRVDKSEGEYPILLTRLKDKK
ncbi:MAG: hypothetical protein HYV39_01840, partial [Candidatus Levybacteria bacterium]|nr:hypothetical protein [Candidatus Levybacteria bacterium]